MEDFPSELRIKNRARIGLLFSEGTTGIAGAVLVRALPNPDGPTRIVAVAGKKIGGAVQRNRMRRRLRAAFRTGRERLPEGWDFALVARKGLLEAAWRDVIRDMEKAAGRAVADTRSGHPRNPSRP